MLRKLKWQIPQENLSRLDKIDARARYRAAAQRLRNTGLDGLPRCSASDTQPVSRNFSVNLRTALQWVTGVSGNVSANFFCTKSLYLLPSLKTYSTRKTLSSIERTTVSKNWFKQLNNLPVLHFNRCLTADYIEMSRNSSTLQRQLRYWQPTLRTVT